MSEYTPITTDMRMLMGCFTGFTEFERDKFERLCDAIDAIHANLERENESLRRELDRVMGEHEDRYQEGYREGIMDGCAYYDAEHTECLLSEPHGWVELPKDADGEYIRIGDMMERGKSRGHVIALMLSEYPKKWGGGLHWGVQLEGEQAPTALDAFFYHYHAPTVEDVLGEFVARWMETHPDDIPALKAEYAAKLRLVGE